MRTSFGDGSAISKVFNKGLSVLQIYYIGFCGLCIESPAKKHKKSCLMDEYRITADSGIEESRGPN